MNESDFRAVRWAMSRLTPSQVRQLVELVESPKEPFRRHVTSYHARTLESLERRRLVSIEWEAFHSVLSGRLTPAGEHLARLLAQVEPHPLHGGRHG